MIRRKVDDLIGGWFVGAFSPTAYNTNNCEVSFKIHSKGEYIKPHYHKLADEINYLFEGSMLINGERFDAPEIFIIEKGEVARPTFITDVKLIVVKVPGALNDKYEVD
jgi:hypothetical protein